MYRINAKPPEPIYTYTWWELNGYRVIAAFKMAVVGLAVLGIMGAAWLGIAAGLQYVVNGFSPYPVGTFSHYVVAVFLFWFFHFKLEIGRR